LYPGWPWKCPANRDLSENKHFKKVDFAVGFSALGPYPTKAMPSNPSNIIARVYGSALPHDDAVQLLRVSNEK
jgi:hypothetical protein